MSTRNAFHDLVLGRAPSAEPEIYVEQVDQLFGHVGLLLTGAVGVLLVDMVAWRITGDWLYGYCAGCLVLLTFLRWGMLRAYDSARPTAIPDMARRVSAMRRWEAAYTVATVTFASVVGIMAYAAMTQPREELHVYMAFFSSIFACVMSIRNATRPRVLYAQVACIMASFTAGVVTGPAPNYWWLLAMIPMQIMGIRSTTALIHNMLLKAMRSALLSNVLRQQLETALGSMSQGLCMADEAGTVLVANARFSDVLCTTERVSSGSDLSVAADDSGLSDIYARMRADGTQSEGIVTSRDGRSVEARMRRMPGGGSLVVVEDVTDREKAAERIRHMAHHDDLTGLPNRVMFGEELRHRLDAGRKLALLCLDLDQFKEVNDSLGHPLGDRLLVEVAGRLRDLVRPGDFVGRFGGDEFMVLVDLNGDEEHASLLAQRTVERISQAYRIHEHDITVGLSIGIALSGDAGMNADDLVKNSDMALYRSKANGRGRYCVFRPEMDAEAQRRRQLEADLRQAIADDAFTVAYQPIVDIETGRVKCCEALVRWVNRGENVPPLTFIKVAEQTGMIVDIGGIVLRKACREAMRWPADVRVAVNLSDIQFRRNVVVSQVHDALRMSGLSADRLEVEITESLAMDDVRHTLSVLGELRRMGVRIALDDFGTGHTSLSWLDEIPFDKVKVDKTLINEIVHNDTQRRIVTFVADLAKAKGREVVAEGVEEGDQVEALRELGVRQIQGYFYSRPRPGDEALDFINERRPARTGLRAAA